MSFNKYCLTIGGSHPTSQAGIQSDLLCAMFWNIYSGSIITSVTAQNQQSFKQKKNVSSSLLKSQIHSFVELFTKPYTKIGLISNSKHYQILTQEKKLFGYLLCDPILKTTTGYQTCNKLSHLLKFIKKSCDFITPNFEEFSSLCKQTFNTQQEIYQALKTSQKTTNAKFFSKGGIA